MVFLRGFDDYNVQSQSSLKLKFSIVAFCEDCHQTTHMGYAGINGKGDEAEKHLQNIKKFTEEELKNISKMRLNYGNTEIILIGN